DRVHRRGAADAVRRADADRDVAGARDPRAVSADPLRYFRVEAAELLEDLEQGALTLERGAGDEALVRRLLRHAHTLKGAARVVRLDPIGDLSHAIETALAAWR